MKKSILLTAIVLLLTASAGFSQMTDVKETITAKEKEMYEAIMNKDMDTFQANLAESFIAVYGTGISTRSQELESVKNLTIRSYAFEDIRVMEPAENIAIIAYSYTADGTYMNEEFSGKYFASSTWVMEEDGTWKAVLHTDVEAAPMEDVGMIEDN